MCKTTEHLHQHVNSLSYQCIFSCPKLTLVGRFNSNIRTPLGDVDVLINRDIFDFGFDITRGYIYVA